MIPPSCSTSRALRACSAGQTMPSTTSVSRSRSTERFREFAQTDSDFDLIRDDLRFKELVG
jgi:hypothetical protein